MLRYEIDVSSPADHVLFDGLPVLQPVLDQLGPHALLIGGLVTAAWLDARPIGLPVRATRDIDLGIDRVGLGIRRGQAPIAPLLRAQQFAPGFNGEDFRFSHDTERGPLVVDLLVAAGASRARPPIVEQGLPSLAAPGLAYAIRRGPVPLTVVLRRGDVSRSFAMHAVTLDAAFVMKATLVVSGVRTEPDKRITDTADAVMLAAACARDPAAMRALAGQRANGEAKKAIAWIQDRFSSPTSAEARRVSRHTLSDAGAAWAVDAAAAFTRALRA
jgi:hypothetical protein